MKGFIAIVLDLISTVKIENLKKPLHLVFSYDEEIGCVGIQKMVPFLKKLESMPSYCIVGEPTSMQVITGHKGKHSYNVHVHGFEAHSSLAPVGVNAIEFAARFIARLRAIADRIQVEGPSCQFSGALSRIGFRTVGMGE